MSPYTALRPPGSPSALVYAATAEKHRPASHPLYGGQRGHVSAPWTVTPRSIRQRRQARDWSQAMLAAELGVSRELVTAWEHGRSTPSPEHEARLREVLG